jgi:rhodanese-related sulfurtransferase
MTNSKSAAALITDQEGQLPHEALSAEKAQELFDALAPVQEALRKHHIPCTRVRLITIELRSALPVAFPEHRMPALEVWDRQGKVVAVVRAGARSRAFYLTVPSQQSEPHLVPVETPEVVVTLIPGYERGAS